MRLIIGIDFSLPSPLNSNLMAVNRPNPSGGQAQASVQPAVRPASPSFKDTACIAHTEADGSLTVTLSIDPVIARRLEGRAGKQDLGEYLWQNVLRRAIEGHVFIIPLCLFTLKIFTSIVTTA